MVELVQRGARIAGQPPRRPQRHPRDRAERGGRRALADDVAHHDDRARRRVDHLVEVAAGRHVLARGAVDRGDVAARQHGRGLGAQPGGEDARHLHAVAEQPVVAQRVGDPPGQRVRHLEIGLVEAPVRLGRDQGERAEHLLAGAQRDDEQRGEADRLEQREVLVVLRRVAQHRRRDAAHQQRLARPDHARAPPVVVEPRGMARAQPARQLDLLRVEVRDRDLLEDPAGAGQVDRAPVGERRHGQLGDPLERGREVGRRAELAPGLDQHPLPDLGPSGRSDVLGDIDDHRGPPAVVEHHRGLRREPGLPAGAGVDAPHEHGRRRAPALQRAHPAHVVAGERPPVGVVEREPLEDRVERQRAQRVERRGADQLDGGLVREQDRALRVAHGHGVVHARARAPRPGGRPPRGRRCPARRRAARRARRGSAGRCRRRPPRGCARRASAAP